MIYSVVLEFICTCDCTYLYVHLLGYTVPIVVILYICRSNGLFCFKNIYLVYPTLCLTCTLSGFF
jgi:hypothetical protein